MQERKKSSPVDGDILITFCSLPQCLLQEYSRIPKLFITNKVWVCCIAIVNNTFFNRTSQLHNQLYSLSTKNLWPSYACTCLNTVEVQVCTITLSRQAGMLMHLTSTPESPMHGDETNALQEGCTCLMNDCVGMCVYMLVCICNH